MEETAEAAGAARSVNGVDLGAKGGGPPSAAPSRRAAYRALLDLGTQHVRPSRVPWIVAGLLLFVGFAVNVRNREWDPWLEQSLALAPGPHPGHRPYMSVADFLLIVWLAVIPVVIQHGVVAEREFARAADRVYHRGIGPSVLERWFMRRPDVLLAGAVIASAATLVGTEAFTLYRWALFVAFFFYAAQASLSIFVYFDQIKHFFETPPEARLLHHADRICGLGFVVRFGSDARISLYGGVLATPMAIALIDEAHDARSAHGHWWPMAHASLVVLAMLAWVWLTVRATFYDRAAIARWVRAVREDELVAIAEAKKKAIEAPDGVDDKETSRLAEKEKAVLALQSRGISPVGIVKAVAPLAANLGSVAAALKVLQSMQGASPSSLLDAVKALSEVLTGG